MSNLRPSMTCQMMYTATLKVGQEKVSDKRSKGCFFQFAVSMNTPILYKVTH